MSTNDPIADFLTRIRNANHMRHHSVDMFASKEKVSIADILMREGYIDSYQVIGDSIKKILNIRLKYAPDKQRVINNLKRVSKPGLRIYLGSDKLKKVMRGLGIAILSTNKGIITDKQARKFKIGGEVLAYVW